MSNEERKGGLLLHRLAAQQIESLGGENAVQRLVLAMLDELAAEWLVRASPPDEAAIYKRCAEELRERINLLGDR